MILGCKISILCSLPCATPRLTTPCLCRLQQAALRLDCRLFCFVFCRHRVVCLEYMLWPNERLESYRVRHCYDRLHVLVVSTPEIISAMNICLYSSSHSCFTIQFATFIHANTKRWSYSTLESAPKPNTTSLRSLERLLPNVNFFRRYHSRHSKS